MNRIGNIFKNRTRKVIPFFTAGYPSLEDTVDMVFAAEKAGADMVELGIPFSDPLADGPIIQESSQVAINNGVTIKWILIIVEIIRNKSNIPIILMGYINPILHYGLSGFISSCKKSGVDGLIIPDLPLEEAKIYVKLAKENGISPILLVAPNTDNDRMRKISQMATDLIYCVAILGVTGTSVAKEKQLKLYLNRVKKYSKCPFIVGFGIKNRKDVIKINKIAHGVVIGSAIIHEIKKSKIPAISVQKYIEKLTD